MIPSADAFAFHTRVKHAREFRNLRSPQLYFRIRSHFIANELRAYRVLSAIEEKPHSLSIRKLRKQLWIFRLKILQLNATFPTINDF